jgi:N-acetylglucosamine kinase-like BadF-type ATPase
VLAVDGGNSKTDVAIVTSDGRLLGTARYSESSNAGLSRDGSVEVIQRAVRLACVDARLEPDGRPIAGTGVYCLAGADLPIDDRRIAKVLTGLGLTTTTVVRNDTFAVLRAGTGRGWGVAMVCGAGMNCAGVGPDGRIVRFPALGELSGDQASGGGWVGMRALGAAIRARDGRGPRTQLERMVPAHFGLSRPGAVMEAMYVGRLDPDRVVELPPVVFRAATDGDAVARTILDGLADEVVAMAGAAIRRLRVRQLDVEVILGGGVFLGGDGAFLERVERGIAGVAPKAIVRRLAAPPVLGAALLGLDAVHADPRAEARVRRALTHARLAPAQER